MCDPMSLIGLVGSIGGAMVQAKAQSSYTNAVNKANRDAYAISKQARLAEQARQTGFQTQANSAWANTVGKLTSADHAAAQQASTDAFMENYNSMNNVVPEGFMLSGQDMTNDTIKTEIAKKANTAAADARKRVQALASLSAYGNTDLTRSAAIGNNANTLATINSLRSGSLNVSQQEQNITPAQVTMGSTIMGDVLSGLGGLAASKAGGSSAGYRTIY